MGKKLPLPPGKERSLSANLRAKAKAAEARRATAAKREAAKKAKQKRLKQVKSTRPTRTPGTPGARASQAKAAEISKITNLRRKQPYTRETMVATKNIYYFDPKWEKGISGLKRKASPQSYMTRKDVRTTREVMKRSLATQEESLSRRIKEGKVTKVGAEEERLFISRERAKIRAAEITERKDKKGRK